ncbi:MAG: carboxypeptidase regulatory-like domain-containing protein, partial [Bryobacterales bacterium]|nr:carboxypeptidase regulatory-like domain-containing protein [Bryobacterales bacterium]
MHIRHQLFRLAAACFFAGSLLLAQNVNSTLVGVVKDASGAFVPSADVTVTNEGTSIETKTKTNESGNYVVPGLPNGQYTVRIEAAGFKPNVVKGVTLLPSRTIRQDITLEVGTVQQAVEVSAGVPVVNTENATIGNIMQTQQITTVP